MSLEGLCEDETEYVAVLELASRFERPSCSDSDLVGTVNDGSKPGWGLYFGHFFRILTECVVFLSPRPHLHKHLWYELRDAAPSPLIGSLCDQCV